MKHTITTDCIKRLRNELKYSTGEQRKQYHKRNGEPMDGLPLFFASFQAYEPVDLWHGLWHQGEIACLFGEPNVGKTLLAMQIANELNKRGLKTIYFDFENAWHQFRTRYCNDKLNYRSGDGHFEVMRFNPNYSSAPHDNHSVINYIKAEMVTNQATVIIIDDINNLLGTGDQADVRFVLNTLRQWSQMFLVSILVIAHSKRKKMSQLTTIDTLSGSYELSYFFDSIFSLSRANRYNAAEHGITHYIKQHKNRVGEIIYDDENVITAQMGRCPISGMLQFNELTTGGNERQLLRDFGYRNDQEITQAILTLHSKFYSTREIAEIVGCSQSHVSRTIRKNQSNSQNNENNPNNGDNCLFPAKPRIKLEPDLTLIYDDAKTFYDFYGDPLTEEEYNKIRKEEEEYNNDDGYDGFVSSLPSEPSLSSEPSESLHLPPSIK